MFGLFLQIRHEVSFKNITHKICSDACFNRYRMANGLIMNCCEQCGNYLPSRATANHFLLIDGQQKRFCCQNCVRDYKQVNDSTNMIYFSTPTNWNIEVVFCDPVFCFCLYQSAVYSILFRKSNLKIALMHDRTH